MDRKSITFSMHRKNSIFSLHMQDLQRGIMRLAKRVVPMSQRKSPLIPPTSIYGQPH
jgi:hypothetical protein